MFDILALAMNFCRGFEDCLDPELDVYKYPLKARIFNLRDLMLQAKNYTSLCYNYICICSYLFGLIVLDFKPHATPL